jgi:hypothetical protein
LPCTPGCTQTSNLPAWGSQVLGLQAHTTSWN